VGGLQPLNAVSDTADLALEAGWNVVAAGRVYHQTGAVFGFDRLRAAAAKLLGGDRYERQALRQLIEDLLHAQMVLARSVMASSTRDTGRESVEQARQAVDVWAGERPVQAMALAELIAGIEAEGEGWSFAKLTIVGAAIRLLTGTAQASV
jgi:glutamate dehydrogenase